MSRSGSFTLCGAALSLCCLLPLVSVAQSKIPIANFAADASLPRLDPNQIGVGTVIDSFQFNSSSNTITALTAQQVPVFIAPGAGTLFSQQDGSLVTVFAFDDINLRGRSITTTGQFPIAIVSRGNAVFDAPVIASGQNADGRSGALSGSGLAPGGRGGRGINNSDSDGRDGFPNGGIGGSFIAADGGQGGGGGGFGGSGGDARNNPHAPASGQGSGPSGNLSTGLRAGNGGGGGSGSSGCVPFCISLSGGGGGGGGGGIELGAIGTLTLSGNGLVVSNGGNGDDGETFVSHGGTGGGGSGGGIRLQGGVVNVAPALLPRLVANGGSSPNTDGSDPRGGGGGGGRILIDAGDFRLNSFNFQAVGGAGRSSGTSGVGELFNFDTLVIPNGTSFSVNSTSRYRNLQVPESLGHDIRVEPSATLDIGLNPPGQPQTLIVENNSLARIRTNLTLDSISGPGRVRVEQQQLVLTDGGDQVFEGTLELQAPMIFTSGTDLELAGPIQGSQPITKDGAGKLTLSGPLSGFNSGVTAKSGSLEINSGGPVGVTIENGAVLQGSAVLRTLTVDEGGLHDPGSSAGLTTITDAYNMNGTLRIELGGTAPAEFDRVAVSGAATIAGNLAVETIPGFTPSAGDSFEFLTAAMLNGQFQGLTQGDRVATFGNVDFVIDYTDTSIWLRGVSPLNCDFDGNLLCDVEDLNLLVSEGPIASGVPVVVGQNEQFDLNGDGTIDLGDRNEWLAAAASENGLPSPYLLADANLDGAVDGLDFSLWNQQKFSMSLLWSEGDFNSDGFVDGLDFSIWNQNKFTSAFETAVPEPSAAVFGIGLFVFVMSSRYRCRTPGAWRLPDAFAKRAASGACCLEDE